MTMKAATNVSREQLARRREKELAEIALEDRGASHGLDTFRKTEFCPGERGRSDEVDYERYGLIPVHRDIDSWIYVSEDPQLAIAIEEIVNTFSPALSVELLLYNVLGSNSESATCLVRYLINYYSSNLCEHIKTTLRNMIRWTVLAGFVPCVFLPWKKLRTLGLGLSGKATVTNLVSSNPAVHREAYRKLGCCDNDEDEARYKQSTCKRSRKQRRRAVRGAADDEYVEKGGGRERHEPFFSIVRDGLSPPEAASEAVQEREAHERALPSVLDVPLDRLADTLKLLMSNCVPETQVSVVCKIIRDWVERDFTLRRDPIKETELKMAAVTLWGVMKTFEHGRCPVVPECRAAACLAFYDRETDLVTAGVDGVVYRHISVWDSCWSRGCDLSSLAKRAHRTVKSWATLFHRIIQGLTVAATRHVYTSTGVDRSSLTHLADVMLSSRGEQQHAGFSVAGNAFGKPLLDNLSRFLASDQQPGMFGLNTAELPDMFLRPGVGTTVSEHKAASVSHSVSKMMASMISEGKEVLLVRQFLREVTRHPLLALERLKNDCKDRGLLQMAESVARQLEHSACDDGDAESDEPVTELGSDVKLVCNYPSSVSVAHLEETLSMWTNFWRSALSGFCQFNRRLNTIQYNNRDSVRELESGSPVHIFHSMLVTLLNTSGVTFADSLTGRKPDASLTVNDIMLTRDSLHPTAYGLLLANKLGLRPSDVKYKDEKEQEQESRGVISATEYTAGLLSTTSASNSSDSLPFVVEGLDSVEARGAETAKAMFDVQLARSLEKGSSTLRRAVAQSTGDQEKQLQQQRVRCGT